MIDPNTAREALTPDPKEGPAKTLAEQRAALLKQVGVVGDKEVDRVAGEFDKRRGGSNEKTYDFFFKGAKTDVLSPLVAKVNAFKERAKWLAEGGANGETIQRLSDLKVEMELELKTDRENIVAFLNNIMKTEFDITKTALAKLETYKGMLIFMMKSPSAKPLVDIFKEIMVITSLTPEQQKVIEEAFLGSNKEIAILAADILGLSKGSLKENFMKTFMDKHPEKALSVLLFANQYGAYSAFDMKKYYEYAINTYEKKEEPAYQEARKEFLVRMDKFDEESEDFQAAYVLQERIKKLAIDLDTKAYGEDAASMLRPGTILKFGAKVVAYTSLAGNLLANRPRLMALYREKGLFPAVASFGTMPYVAGGIGTLFGVSRLDSERSNAEFFAGKPERDAKEYAKGLERLEDLVERHSTWGMFLENEGFELLLDYKKELKDKEGLAKEPTIAGFKEFLTRRGEKMDEKPCRYLGEKVLNGKFEKDETANLKSYLSLIDDQQISSQTDFNKRLDDARENT